MLGLRGRKGIAAPAGDQGLTIPNPGITRRIKGTRRLAPVNARSMMSVVGVHDPISDVVRGVASLEGMMGAMGITPRPGMGRAAQDAVVGAASPGLPPGPGLFFDSPPQGPAGIPGTGYSALQQSTPGDSRHNSFRRWKTEWAGMGRRSPGLPTRCQRRRRVTSSEYSKQRLLRVEGSG